ncbi:MULTISPECIES: cytochrome b [Vibrio]|uniref:Putative cytochrome b561 homolog n=1 Tax=Vibrio proteolyticus NBRC 13287 TaxID=1219065 RepID=U3BL52_VIBPR|nr:MULTISPECIES: cytochrome b [Vibrio]NAW56930.1 cytochrome b [Vibrio sp. V36_P2S2PM302]NAX20356.1 cytochrome b [Vibrio sp. V39_P1S14PM300]NAX28070.1 cytochrome b [Vibrio sp. V38_P2S17PM301]NAX30093.1 cytochrome b [Vibrio sp. V37_P2S8PM304]GAD67328.1 putative cytochrome b561 homolog [Vibrio proteolyticus NBRC 13287]
MSTEVKNYNAMVRAIHWISAAVIIGMFAVGLWMVDLTYYSQWYKTAPHWHKSVGIILAAVTIFRIVWKHVTLSPKVEGKAYEVILAKLAHSAIYLLLLVIFISGYLISTEDGRGIDVFNWFTVPGAGAFFEGQADTAGTIHYYAAWALILLAALHAVAALKHHFIDKDNTLRKMIGASK